jgi:hypothetical protein
MIAFVRIRVSEVSFKRIAFRLEVLGTRSRAGLCPESKNIGFKYAVLLY